MRMFKLYRKRLAILLDIITVLILRIISKIIKKHDHWILIERGQDARDNAYFFYEYLKENHPKQKVYYIIDKMVICINISSMIYLYCLGTCGYSSVEEIICQCSLACKNLVQELKH